MISRDVIGEMMCIWRELVEKEFLVSAKCCNRVVSSVLSFRMRIISSFWRREKPPEALAMFTACGLLPRKNCGVFARGLIHVRKKSRVMKLKRSCMKRNES